MYRFKVTEAQAFRDVKQKVKLMSNGTVNIKTYHKAISKKIDGYESVGDTSLKKGRISSINVNKENKSIRKDSLSRTRNRLLDLAYENEKDWYTFVTLTFKDNVKDIQFANKAFNNFTKQIKRAFPNFKYLGVPEFQKRGAVHYHLLTNLKCNTPLCPLQKGQTNMYDVKYWTHGYVSVFNLSNTDDKFNVGLYLIEYLYKDIDERLWGRNKILKSNNLRNPTLIELEEESEKYDYVKEYIKSKGYECIEKEIIPQKQYAIPFTVLDTKVSKQDISYLIKKMGKELSDEE